MVFMLLFLGLLPIMFLPDAFDGGEQADLGNGTGGDDMADEAGQGVVTADVGALLPDESDPLLPDESDPLPPENPIEVDESTVIAPDESDANPDDYGAPVGDGAVLDPIDTPAEEYPADGDGTLLQQLLAEQSDATTGIGYLGTRITDTDDLELSGGDDTFSLPDDALPGTGEGALGSWDGTPLVLTGGDLNVVSGGAGNDVLTAGDEAAYLFGGAGDDVLAAGDGAGALFGGDGDDTITGSDSQNSDGTAAAYLDGGRGDDLIIGGDGNEVISGGEHASDAVAGDDTLYGGGGNDAIRGGLGADYLSGGDGDDVLDHFGNAEEQVAAEQRDFGWHIDNDPDVLDGGDGNDTLIFDRADTVTGGAGADTFWLYFDTGSGAGFAEITDFSPGEDFLRISLNPELTSGTPALSVAPSEDGSDGVVTVNGEVIAVLRGAPDASVADIYVDVPPNLF